MLLLPGMSQAVPGTVVSRARTSSESAFAFRYVTVRLYRDIIVTDFHETGSMLGDWFLLDQPGAAAPAGAARTPARAAARTARIAPSSGPKRLRLPAGAIVNVGPAVSGPSGQTGAGLAEFVSGPPPTSI